MAQQGLLWPRSFHLSCGPQSAPRQPLGHHLGTWSASPGRGGLFPNALWAYFLFNNHRHVMCSSLNPSLQKKWSFHHWLSLAVSKWVCILESPGESQATPQSSAVTLSGGWVTGMSSFWFHGQAGLEAKAEPDQGSLSWLGSGVTCSRVLDQGRGVHGEEAIGHHRPQPWSTSALFWVLPSLPDCINLGNIFKLMFLRLLSENNHTNLQHCLTIKWGKKILRSS